jgi:ABC-type sugar transport system permease subunit
MTCMGAVGCRITILVGKGGGEVRFIRRALLEHRRLPRLVRIFRTCQAVGIAFLVSSMFAVLILRPSTAVMNVWLVIVTTPLLVSVFGVGLLTWRNYQHAAEIWAENVRGRGLDSAGLGWLMDAGTARAIGAVKALFTAAMVVAVTIQTIWP